MTHAAALLLAATLHAGLEQPVANVPRDVQPYTQSVVDAASNDEKALVVWADGDVLRGVRVDRDGNPLDDVPLLIAYTTWREAWVARGATNWLVVWDNPAGIRAKTIADDGTAGDEIVLSITQGVPRVAFDGASFLVAWSDAQGRLLGARLSANGQLLENNFAIAPGETRWPVELLANDEGFVLVAGAADVAAMRLDANGRRVSQRSLMATVEAQGYRAGVEANGNIVVAWRTAQDRVYVKREGLETMILPENIHAIEDFVTIGNATYAITRANERALLVNVASGATRELDTRTFGARAASFGDRVLLATSYDDVIVTMLDDFLQLTAPPRLAFTERRLQYSPAVAQAGDTRLAVWIEPDDEGSTNIVAKRNDDEPFVVANDAYGVAIATDGSDFLVSWHGGFLQLFFRLIHRDGTMGPVHAISGWAQGSCVAWTGSDYILGWVSIGALRPLNSFVTAQRVTREGEPSGDTISIDSGPAQVVACASTDTATLFAWSTPAASILGKTLSHGGTISGAFDIGEGFSPTVAAHDDAFVVAHPSSYVTVTEGGTVGAPRFVDSDSVRVLPRNGGYLLVYGTDAMRARALDASGNPISNEVIIANDAWGAAFAGGTLFYHRDTDILPEPRWRVFTRALEIDETPTRRRAMRR